MQYIPIKKIRPLFLWIFLAKACRWPRGLVKRLANLRGAFYTPAKCPSKVREAFYMLEKSFSKFREAFRGIGKWHPKVREAFFTV